jgi:hypothetical protein
MHTISSRCALIHVYESFSSTFLIKVYFQFHDLPPFKVLLYFLYKTRIRLLLEYIVMYIVFCLLYFESQFFSYLATVTITGDRAGNLDLCLVLTAFSSEGSFTCHTYCDTGPPFLRSYPKDPWFYLLNAVLLAKEQSLPILNVLCVTRPARAGLELTTYRLLSESTTTRLRQPVYCKLRYHELTMSWNNEAWKS